MGPVRAWSAKRLMELSMEKRPYARPTSPSSAGLTKPPKYLHPRRSGTRPYRSILAGILSRILSRAAHVMSSGTNFCVRCDVLRASYDGSRPWQKRLPKARGPGWEWPLRELARACRMKEYGSRNSRFLYELKVRHCNAFPLQKVFRHPAVWPWEDHLGHSLLHILGWRSA